tara:strand:- start:30758 stop:31093 length:336 start_codon:yes stop_codon:yes gene_type:complete
MSKKLIITEHQFTVINNHINETVANVRLRNQIYDFLSADYEPSGGVEKLANEFYPTALIKKKIDGEVITPAALFKYMKHKFKNVDTSILKDCLEGWYKGDYNKETGMRKRK